MKDDKISKIVVQDVADPAELWRKAKVRLLFGKRCTLEFAPKDGEICDIEHH